MNHLNTSIVGILLLVVATASLCYGSTVLVNPDFETGDSSGWEKTAITGIRPWALGQDSPQNGAWYAFTLGEATLTQRFFPIIGSNVTEFNFWAFRPSESSFSLEIFYASGSPSGAVDFSSEIFGGWANYDALPLIDTSRQVTGFSITKLGTGTARLDNFSLSAVPEPSATILIFCGIGILLKRTRSVWLNPSKCGMKNYNEPTCHCF